MLVMRCNVSEFIATHLLWQRITSMQRIKHEDFYNNFCPKGEAAGARRSRATENWHGIRINYLKKSIDFSYNYP
jgi:hypothetical protein